VIVTQSEVNRDPLLLFYVTVIVFFFEAMVYAEYENCTHSPNVPFVLLCGKLQDMRGKCI
jgi:hypothetical protein